MSYFTLTFLRHGESVGNAKGYFQGQKDYPLTERGKSQVRRLINRWQADDTRFDRVVTSPLVRAKTTAEMICDAFRIPLDVDENWQERDRGLLTGVRPEDSNDQDKSSGFYTPFNNIGETGEGNWALYLRAGRALHRILQRQPLRYLVVSHGGILNQALHSVFGITPQANGQGVHFRFVNTAFATVYYYPDQHKWVVWGLNDFTHLAVRNFDLNQEDET